MYIDDRCVQCNCNFCGHSSSTVVLYLYRSLFDGVELCRHCPGVVDQALVHGTFLYPNNHFIYPTNLVHGVDDKEEAPTKSHLEWSTTNHLLSVNKIFHYLNSSRMYDLTLHHLKSALTLVTRLSCSAARKARREGTDETTRLHQTLSSLSSSSSPLSSSSNEYAKENNGHPI